MSGNMNIIKVIQPLVFAYFKIELNCIYFMTIYFSYYTESFWDCRKCTLINVESSDVCIVCWSSKPHNAPIKINISDSTQGPHKKRTQRYVTNDFNIVNSS